MKDKMFAVTIWLMVAVLLPIAAVGSDKSNAKVQSKTGSGKSKSGSPSPTPGWDITKPSSCSVEGPPPCPKCSVTCDAAHPPICTPGDSAGNVCVTPSTCVCKQNPPAKS